MRQFISSFSVSSNAGGGASPLPPSFSFIAFGDIQFTEGTTRGTPRQYMVRDSLLYAMGLHPNTDFLISVGDYGDTTVVNGDATQYDELNAIMNNYSNDKYNSFGNHDSQFPSKLHNPDIVDFLSYTPFKSLQGMPTVGYGYEKRTDSGVYVILMDAIEDAYQGAAAGNSASGHFHYLQSQVDWLQSLLDSITEENARLIIVTHAPWKTDTFRTGQIPREYQHEQTQADVCIQMLLDWQQNSNKGLVLAILSGHTHIDGTFRSGTGDNVIDHYTLDEFDEITPGYAGDANTITTDTAHMAVSVFSWNEAQKVLTITGYGANPSFLVDMSQRVS